MNREQLEHCCASTRWVELMLKQAPFANEDVLMAAATEAESHLVEKDWLEAFDGHPKIGDVNSLKKKYAATQQMAGHEQSGVNSADDATLQALAAGNSAYEEKFGFIFIVCATGKSAAEMLALLQQRLPNPREDEIRNAAREQAKITRIRLKKLLEQNPAGVAS